MNAQLVTHGLGVPSNSKGCGNDHWPPRVAAARRAAHLTDGYGVVIALTANECAICATSSGG
jgi:hypothetical protein